MTRIYLDSDVLLDFLYQREPFFNAAVQVIALLEKGKVQGTISTLILWNVAYLLEKEFGRKEGRRKLRILRSLVHLVAIDEKIIDEALNSDMKDFEDAVQYHAALGKKLPFFLTRNKKDYPRGSISLLTCEEFLIQRAQ